MRRAAWLVVVLWAVAAGAHDADVVFVHLEQATAGGAVREVVTLTPASLALLAPIDADGDQRLTQADLDASAAALRAGVWDQMPLSATVACARSAERATLADGYVELSARFACAEGELSQTFRWLSILPGNYRVVLGSQLGDAQGRAQAQGSTQTLHLARPMVTRAPAVLGATHRFVGGLVPLLVDWQRLALLVALLSIARPSFVRSLYAAALLPVVIALGQLAGSVLPATGWAGAVAALVIAAAAGCAVFEASAAMAWPLAAAFGLAHGLDRGDASDPEAAVALGALVGTWALAAVGVIAARLARRWRWGPRLVAALVLGLSGFWLVERLAK